MKRDSSRGKEWMGGRKYFDTARGGFGASGLRGKRRADRSEQITGCEEAKPASKGGALGARVYGRRNLKEGMRWGRERRLYSRQYEYGEEKFGPASADGRARAIFVAGNGFDVERSRVVGTTGAGAAGGWRCGRGERASEQSPSRGEHQRASGGSDGDGGGWSASEAGARGANFHARSCGGR